MIEAVSSSQTPAIAYAGGAAPTSAPGFGAALTAKLAEFQAMAPGAVTHHHHKEGFGVDGAKNQDAGNSISLPDAGSKTLG